MDKGLTYDVKVEAGLQYLISPVASGLAVNVTRHIPFCLSVDYFPQLAVKIRRTLDAQEAEWSVLCASDGDLYDGNNELIYALS